MDIRAAVRAALLADAAVAALVGDRIYPLEAPQGERRLLLVINRVSESEDTTLKGGAGLLVSRVQVDAWGQTVDDAAMLAEPVRARLQGLSGAFGGVIITGIFAGSIREGKDSETGAYRAGRDFSVYSRRL